MRNNGVPPLPNGRTTKTTEEPIDVLCVDDETSFLASTKQLLEMGTSFRVDLASSVADALEKLKSEVFDVVVSDYQMPEKNGLDFLKELRDSGNDVPFILFTGKGREEVAVKALNLGADRYFNKFGNPETVYGQLVHGIRQAVAQRRAEKEIWDREERLRAVFSSSPDAMFTCDLNGIVTDCNLQTLKILGASSMSEIVGKNYQTFVVTAEKENVELAFHEVLEKSFITNRETKLITKNGTEVPIGFSASILRDAYGKPVGAVALTRNISDRKKAEAKLRQSESKFRGFFENSPDYCYMISPEGKILEVSNSVLNFLGYKRDELVGKPLISTIYAPSSRQKAKKLFEKWKKTGKIKNHELEIVTKQGERRTILLSVHSVHDLDGQLLHSVSVQKDVTEHRRADSALRESEEKYRSIVELSPDGIATMNLKGTITSVNKAFLDLTGFSEDEIVGKHFTKLGTLRLQDIPKYTKLVYSVLRGKNPGPIEFDYLRKDGTHCIGEAHLRVMNEKGKKIGLQAILADITERKQMEKELKDSEEKYRNIIELSPDGIIFSDMNGMVTSVNQAILIQTGFSEKDFLGKHFTQLAAVPSESLSEITRAVTSFLGGDTADVFELVYCCKDGTRLVAEASIGLLKRKGEPYGLQVMLRDITERKKMERELKDSEEKYRMMVEQAPDSIITFDLNGVVTSCNDTAAAMSGCSREELVGKHFSEFSTVDEAQLQRFKDSIAFVTERGAPEPFEVARLDKDGNPVFGEIHVSLLKEGEKVTGFQTITRDITARKRAEEKLRDSERKFRTISDAAQDSIILIGENGEIVYWNLAAEKTFGYTKEEAIGKELHSFIAPERFYENYRKGLKKFKKTGQGSAVGKTLELFARRKDGTEFPIELSLSALKIKSKWCATGIVRDITEHKKAEAALRESEKRFRELSELLPEVIFETDEKGFLNYVNHAGLERFGYSQEEFEVGLHAHQMLVPEDRDLARETLRKVLTGESPGSNEYTGLKKDGTTFPIIVNSTPIIRDKKAVGIRGLMVDITERKKAEEVLAKERKTLEKVTGNLQAKLVMVSKDYRILWANKYLTDALGDVTGQVCYKALNRRDSVCPGCKVAEVIKTGKRAVHEQLIKHPTHGEYLLNITAIPIKDEKGNVTEVLELAVDITERKKAEAALRESEKRFRELSELLPEVIFEIDITGVISFVNRGALDLFGFSEQDLEKGLNLIEMLTPESQKKAQENLDKLLSGEDMGSNEYTVVRKDGSTFPCMAHYSVIVKEGKPVGIRGIIVDITERKKAEDELKDTLEKMENLNEKLSVIGKLTRHDARNKLAVIANNIYLAKSKLAPNNNTLENLSDIESSLNQMEKIFDFARNYELLGTEELSYVDVKRSFDEAVMLLSCPDNIAPLADCEGLKVRADSLLRQTFYNLIDNSVKYGEKVSQIKVHCTEKPDSLKLVYEDDGVGIPETEKEKIFVEGYGKGTGFGLYLIRKICENYGWTIQETGVPGEGTQFTMTIPKTNKNGKPNYTITK